MRNQKNYYDILGVPRTATDEEIKRRYRLLVRQHHPDVAKDKDIAKQVFLQIAEAYQTLINPNRRLIYDASIDTQAFRNPPSARPSQSGWQQRTPRRSAQRPSSQQSSTQAQARRTRAADMQRWLSEAQKAFANGQFRSAIYACNEAKRINPRSFQVHVILGDIYRIQGQTDEAIAMYTIAVQLNPKNLDVQAKLDRLVRASASKASPVADDVNERHTSLKIGLNLVGTAIVGFLLTFLAISPGTPVSWIKEYLTFIDTWSSMLIQTLIYTALVAGFLLSFNSQVQHLDDELVFRSVRPAGSNTVSYPMGLLLIVFTFFSFYLAAIIYLLAGLMQESLSKSVLKAFGATLALVLIVTLIYYPGRSDVFLFGGNIAFPAMLAGWTIGDMCRSDW